MSAAQSTNDSNAMSNEEVLDKIISFVKSSDPQEQFTGAALARKWLFHPNRQNFDKDFIQRGFLPIFVNGLQSKNTKMQYECAFLLAFFAESGHVDAMVKAGCIPPLVDLVTSSDNSVAEMSTLTLGHTIVHNNTKYRDLCIAAGIVQALAKRLVVEAPVPFLQHATYAIGNIFNNKDDPPSKEVADILLPGLVKLVQHEDIETLKETLLAISYIAANDRSMVAKTGVARKVINLLDHKEPDIQVNALDILGNIASGTNDHTQYILDIGTLPLMDKFLKSSNKKLNKEACWFLTNFLAGSEEQIQAVFDAGYIPLIIKHLKTGDFATQQKAAKCILNIAVYGDDKNLNTIIDRNVLPALSSFLKVVEDKETKIIELALQGLEKIVLNSPTRKNEMFEQLLENGGIDVLQRLQKYPSDAVSLSAKFILGSLVATEHTVSFHYIGSGHDEN